MLRIGIESLGKALFPTLLLFFGLLAGCADRSVRFDRKGWDAWDGHYYSRKSMADDLINNRLRRGMAFRKIVDMLGKSQSSAVGGVGDSLFSLRYEIDVVYTFHDIDPFKGRDLIVEFGKDSLVAGYEIVEWKSGK